MKDFASIAQPLHSLTQEGAPFCWSPEYLEVFQRLQQRLISSPILVYPDFDKDFVLETEVSAQGLGAVLSQRADDGKLHPVVCKSIPLPAGEALCGHRARDTCSCVGN